MNAKKRELERSVSRAKKYLENERTNKTRAASERDGVHRKSVRVKSKLESEKLTKDELKSQKSDFEEDIEFAKDDLDRETRKARELQLTKEDLERERKEIEEQLEEEKLSVQERIKHLETRQKKDSLNLDRFIARDRARLSRGKATGEAEQLSAKLDDTKIQEEKKKEGAGSARGAS